MTCTTPAAYLRLLPIIGMACVLSACGEEQGMSEEEVLAQARTLEDPQAGLYSVTTELVTFDVTGAPPAVADRLKEQMGEVRKSTSERCVTEADAQRGFEPLLKEIAEGINGLSCGFSQFEANAPRFNAELTCSGALDASASIALAGTTSSEGYDVTMDLDASSRLIGDGSMEMRMKVQSERVGACAAEAAPAE